MAKRNYNTTVPEDYEAPKKYAAFHLEWEPLFDFFSDEVAASLTRAILKYVKFGTVPNLEGQAAAMFASWREQIDADLETNRRVNFRREQREQHNQERRERREAREAEKGDNLGEYKGEREKETIKGKYENEKGKEKNQTETQDAREACAEGLDGGDFDFSQYLTPEEEERLLEGAANYDSMLLADFVQSERFNKADSLDAKSWALVAFKEGREKQTAAQERAARLKRYSHGQRPHSFEELRQFLEDIGHAEFDAAEFWEEMERREWNGVRDWQAIARYRAENQPREEPGPEPDSTGYIDF